MARSAFLLVTTGEARPSDELLAELAERTGIAQLAPRGNWLRRLVSRWRGAAPPGR